MWTSVCLPWAAVAQPCSYLPASPKSIPDALAFLDVLKLATLVQHIHQHLVLVLQEFASLIDLGFDVMLIRLGPQPDFLQLLLMRLGLILGLIASA